MAVVQLNLNQNKFEQMKDKPSANTVFMVANRVNVAVVATVVADNVTGIKCVFFSCLKNLLMLLSIFDTEIAVEFFVNCCFFFYNETTPHIHNSYACPYV